MTSSPVDEVDHAALIWLELGGVLALLAVMARLARRVSLSPIPLYLATGLAFGEGGLLPLVTSQEFVEIGAELGVILLLLMLGLEYTGRELIGNLRSSAPVGIADLVLNFLPGFAAGLVLGLGTVPSLFLGGVTYISSSGIVAKVLADLDWTANRETPIVLSVLVFEDLTMAVMLPVLGAVALGGTLPTAVVSVAIALTAVGLVLAVSVRYGERISRLAFSDSDEAHLLTVLGITLLVAGLAEAIHVSAAVGAFLVGIGISGPAAHRANTLLAPLRDLFAAVFFVFFGLATDPSVLPDVMWPVLLLTIVTTATKGAVAWIGGARQQIGVPGRRRAAAALMARGEFSIVIAGIAVAAGASPRLSAIAAGYVLLTATLGPLAAMAADRSPGPPTAPAVGG